MTTKEQLDGTQTEVQEVSDKSGALVAMRRAAKKARQRAIDNDGYVETWRDGKIVRDTEP